MTKGYQWFTTLILLFSSFSSYGAEKEEGFKTVAPEYELQHQLRLRSNLIPWVATVPNIGAEYIITHKWSATLDVWYCPWKITEKLSVKTVALLPEGRYWFKDNSKGSFVNLHLNIVWFNVRANKYRYQDKGTPLLGAGIGYGYRLNLNDKWGLDFEIGAGVSQAKYDRFYNVANGALKDSRSTTYFGIDRFSIAITYNLCDL